MGIVPMFGIAELMVFLTFGMGAGVPLGIPPGPHDPFLFAVAPDQCLYYTTWAGMAKPDPASGNQAEQLMAEQEVQHFLAEGEKHIRQWVNQANAQGNPATQFVPDLFKDVLTHPAALYLESIQLAQGGVDVHAALIVSLGDDVGRVRDMLAALEETLGELPSERVQIGGSPFTRVTAPGDGTPVYWGFKDTYFMLGVGDGSVEGILERAATPVPSWLSKIRGESDIERPATFTYANLKSLITMSAMAGGPETQDIVQALGLNAISDYTSVSGLDKDGFVSRTRIETQGRVTGILEMLRSDGLRVEDVAMIPDDVYVAGVMRLDAGRLFDGWLKIIGEIDPDSTEGLDAWIGQMEQGLGVSIRDDVFNSLGDVWSIYTSPGSGGLLTGWTITVSLENARRVQELHGRLLGFAQGLMMQGNGAMRVRTFQFNDHDVFTLDIPEQGFFLAPSWCITDRHLVLAMMPQTIKAHLARTAEDESIADRPEVASLFSGDTTPSAFAFQDTRVLFETLYPLVQVGIQAVSSQMRREGYELDTSILPSIASISPHLRPTVSAVFMRENGIESLTRQSLPGSNVGTFTPVSIALLLPAVQSAREAARRSQGMNNLKQIGLAMHNYHDVTKAFPPSANVDEDGLPLLSWRVHILPFIEEQRLYEQFHLDEPWDSEHNRKLIAQMPTVYRSPNSVAEPGKTVYLGNAGKNGIFKLPGEDQRGKSKWPSGTQMREIRDGTSNTIMAVEAADSAAVIWTKPSDFEPDGDDPLKGLIGLHPGGFLAGLCDGSVRFIDMNIDKKSLQGMLTRDGGEIVDID